MKSLIKFFFYWAGFALIVYGGENISWQRPVSVGFCLGLFAFILNDILYEIKNK